MVHWAAPELMTVDGFSTYTSDAWAFAVLVWEIFTFSATPYEGGTLCRQEFGRWVYICLVYFIFSTVWIIFKAYFNERSEVLDYCSTFVFDIRCHGRPTPMPVYHRVGLLTRYSRAPLDD